jgi:polar amino acid transport system ATP-binding protein
MNGNEIIIVENITKKFGEFSALSNVSLRIGRGEVVVIVGPSGSGKSTLLRCINHLEIPTSGTIVIDGEQVTHNQKDLNRIRAEVGMVFQQFNLFPHLTVLENITLAQKIVRHRSKEDAARMGHKQLERVGIPEKARRT